ncbi:MAG: DUF2637 domain-containing protein [Rhodococcus sp. (in: high G+C Gram-positive bacteria)]|uniref:DUF2637 domain-containing protein n=1 Tax=Rhodococcus sp. TaxID=1831 RepID=UPI003BAF8791
MTDHNLKAARNKYHLILWCIAAAIAADTLIAAGSFVLSFEVLRDLIEQAGTSRSLSWIFPAAIDVSISSATVSAVILTKIDGARGVAIASGLFAAAALIVSIVCNGYHAYVNPAVTLDPWFAAGLAVIPPVLVLVLTHLIVAQLGAIGLAKAQYDTVQEAVAAAVHEPAVLAHEPAILAQEPSAAVDSIDTKFFDYHEDQLRDTARGVHRDSELADAAVQPAIAAQETSQPTPAPDAITPPAEDPAALQRKELEAFIDATVSDDQTKQAVLLKLDNPDMTFEEIASTLVPPCHTSTAWRKYKKFEALAEEAGFTVPPLPDLGAERGQHEQPQLADSTI